VDCAAGVELEIDRPASFAAIALNTSSEPCIAQKPEDQQEES
jgi:hypothetical protein